MVRKVKINVTSNKYVTQEYSREKYDPFLKTFGPIEIIRDHRKESEYEGNFIHV